jgi:alpha-tubulin suppressor-like RCC1 family protein
VGEDSDWAAVSTGHQCTAALKTDRSLWTWGDDQFGVLGLGGVWPPTRNIPTRVGTDNDWAAIDTGDWHNMAVKTDGSLWAWGFNYYGGPESGVLGDGSDSNRSRPVRVVSTDVAWAAASACGYHTAGLKADGSVWVWGHNQYGQLGRGDTENRLVPAQAWDAGQWASVSAGYMHAAAFKADGSLWAWGDNRSGQLGDGTTIERHSPVKVGEGFRLPVR